MKFLHISDLHLGKRVNEFSMLEDQAFILNQILEIAGNQHADGVLIAGDVYDKSVPSAEAVQLLDDFLTKLAKTSVSVFMISGNHDSAERVAFGAGLLARGDVHISPVYQGSVSPVVKTDAYGEVCIYLLPFLKPAAVRRFFDDREINSYQEAFAAAVERLQIDTDKRNILVAHQFVTGAQRSESEEISVGGLDNIDASLMECFDYTALGHIHRPQQMGAKIRYCGTPLKYSFSEAGDEKSVTVVTLKEKGTVEIETVPLQPLRDLREIRGSYEEVTYRKSYCDTNTEDYVHITLTDEEDIPNAMGRLRAVYPNLMKLDYDNRRTRENRSVEGAEAVEAKSPEELFAEFYEVQNNRELSEKQRVYLTEMITQIWRAENETD